MYHREKNFPKKIYVKSKKVAEITGRACGTLANDRYYGRGLPYIKIRGSVFYDLQDVYDYMESKKIRHED